MRKQNENRPYKLCQWQPLAAMPLSHDIVTRLTHAERLIDYLFVHRRNEPCSMPLHRLLGSFAFIIHTQFLE